MSSGGEARLLDAISGEMLRRDGFGLGGGGGAWGTFAVAEWLGRGGWLSSSRIWRFAAGASAPVGAAAT